MHPSDYSTHFTPQENEWLSTNPKTKKELFKEIEDISNVNPLDNGEPDLRPLEIAVKATKLIITVSKNKILEGPYDAAHFQLIKSTFPEIKFTEKNIWGYFSFLCACRRDEDITNKERIYLSAISNIILQENLEDMDIQAVPQGVFNMDTNETEYVKGEGVNAHMQ
jgi:hypothetical protein